MSDRGERSAWDATTLFTQAGVWAGLYLYLHWIDGYWPRSAAYEGFILAFMALSLTLVGFSYISAARPQPKLSLWLLVALTLLGPLLPPSAFSIALASGALLLLGVAAGAWVGRRIQRASHLWPLALVACAADAWSVASPQGPTQQMLNDPESAWSFATLLLLWLPSPGVGATPLLGVADALLTSLLFGAVYALGLSARRLAVGVTVGFTLCLIALLITATPLPALPFIAITGVAALGPAARPTIKDLSAALLFCAFFVGLAVFAR